MTCNDSIYGKKMHHCIVDNVYREGQHCQGERGHRAVYYNGPQSFIITFLFVGLPT